MKTLVEKRGQVTMFIIVGILVVVGILAMILLSGRDADTLVPSDLGPRDFVMSCVSDAVEDSVEKMMRNGGEALAPQAISYEGEEWTYLCYQAEYYHGCYNIRPMLEVQIEREIVSDTNLAVQGCFNSMREDFEDRGMDVSGGASEYSVDLLPGYVAVSLEKDIEINDASGAQSFRDFSIEIVSPIYDLVRVSREIVNSESQFCDFEYNAYMMIYPKYDIQRVDYRDSKMYRVIDRATGAEFKFAVRSCAFAPGI